ncbi:hypothetical protein G5A69_10700 [Ralstonia mannitolilytica]|nr:hypothetical protein G5A69_10700 [Ralstonia mannitolilytica]
MVETKPRSKIPISLVDIAKLFLMIGFFSAALFLEIYGFKSGTLVYMGIVVVVLVTTTGLSVFTNSYNRLLLAKDKTAARNRLKLSAEKASAIGVVSLTIGVAIGLYNFDATNSEANSAKLFSVQKQMMKKANTLGCQLAPNDPKDCTALHEALNSLWEAVFSSNVKGMAESVDNVHIRWIVLGARWPRQNIDEFNATADGLENLRYRLDNAKPAIALLLAILLLPFSIAATSRKLAVAAFEANFSDDPVTWSMVSKRALSSAGRTLLPWKRRPD